MVLNAQHMARTPDVGERLNRDRGVLSNLYLAQLIPALLLIIYGAVVIWSASLTNPNAVFSRHLFGIALGLVAAILIWRFDTRGLSNMSLVLLVLDALLLISPHIPGLSWTTMGMTGWVKIPFINMTMQPSEPAKLVTILFIASICAEYNGRIESLRDYVRLCAMLCIPFFLILAQPDLGTGLIILVTGAIIIICAGPKPSWVLFTIALIVAGSAFIIIESQIEGIPHILKTYQLNRLIVFVDPSVDPYGSAYNLQQAKIAVGSGGLLGKGLGNATQAAGGFLPESHTDFVFALLAEEFGFAGSVLLLGLYAWTIIATVLLAMRIEAPFPKLILVGCVAMWSFQVLENVGMCIGIMPITGIPLPFISFGSSSMLAQIMAVGMVQSIWRHRQKSG